MSDERETGDRGPTPPSPLGQGAPPPQGPFPTTGPVPPSDTRIGRRKWLVVAICIVAVAVGLLLVVPGLISFGEGFQSGLRDAAEEHAQQQEEGSPAVDAKRFLEPGDDYVYTDASTRQEVTILKQIEDAMPGPLVDVDVDAVNVRRRTGGKAVGFAAAMSFSAEAGDNEDFIEGYYDGISQQAGGLEITEVAGREMRVARFPNTGGVYVTYREGDAFISIFAPEATALDIAADLVEAN